ncbi:MAG: hypothetical protein ACYDBX_02325 [Patescibacteria group bacterium]
MNTYGSKKKKRYAEYLQREAKREQLKKQKDRYNEIMRKGNIEEMATIMGIRLK